LVVLEKEFRFFFRGHLHIPRPSDGDGINRIQVYPLVNIQKTMENHHFIAGKIHQNWPFSIAMLNYQRVTYGVTIPQKGPSSASIFLSSSWDAMAVAAVAAVANTMFG